MQPNQPKPNDIAPVKLSTVVLPQREKVEEVVLHARTRSFNINNTAELLFRFQDPEGHPYDLTDMDESDTFVAFAEEIVRGAVGYKIPVEVKDPEYGLLLVKIDKPLRQGIYRGKVVLMHDDKPMIINPFRIYVNYDRGIGAPSIEEIREYLRDTYPEENNLLEGHLVSDEEITLAVERAVRYFNEVPPDVGRVSTANFPWRMHLMEGILGQLFRMLESHHRKNSLSYQAGGLSVADMDKERNYQSAASYHWDTYRQFVADKKSQINMEDCFGTIPSPYFFI